jgi:hypothetical protein
MAARRSKWRCILVVPDLAMRTPHISYMQPRLSLVLVSKHVMPGLFLHDRCRSGAETSFEEREGRIDLYRLFA